MTNSASKKKWAKYQKIVGRRKKKSVHAEEKMSKKFTEIVKRKRKFGLKRGSAGRESKKRGCGLKKVQETIQQEGQKEIMRRSRKTCRPWKERSPLRKS
jgi:hypothetical protein